jgi:hypothetical protein
MGHDTTQVCRHTNILPSFYIYKKKAVDSSEILTPYQYLSTELHSVTARKTTVLIRAFVRLSDLWKVARKISKPNCINENGNSNNYIILNSVAYTFLLIF